MHMREGSWVGAKGIEMEEGEGEGALNLKKQKNMNMNTSMSSRSRKEKRKAIKKTKRKQMRKEMAERERQEEEAVLNDPEEQHRLHLLELEEARRMERERMEFQERERAYQHQLLLLDKENKEKEKLLLQQSQSEGAEEEEAKENIDDDDEELLPEIIWRGNEIIFNKKKKKKKLLRVPNHHQPLQDAALNTRPSSNPLPPESHIPENVAQQVPNFGTEQDKSHCPFHLKTGACRFGQRCSRVHFYPDNSCTLLIKNMYNGPGLAWEQDEGLEYTDEEVECCYEEFYEDVHTEFLKFGEIVNFKVCKNGSFHLRGNVYVQYKLLDSALLAYNSVNGRYFAGKQISCTFVSLTRWKVAICGEYMKSGFKTCSHGTACNFIHCFRNPGGDYEWADSDKPPPKYWVKKMAALFGYCDDYESSRERENLSVKNSSKMSKTDSDRYHSRRSRSREMDQLNSGRSGRRKHEDERKQISPDEEHNAHLQDNYKRKRRSPDIDSDGEWLEKEENREKPHEHARKSSFNRNYSDNSRSHGEDFDMVGSATITRDTEKQHGREERNSRKWNRDNKDWIYEAESEGYIDRKRYRISKRKSSRHHQSRDNSDVTSEAESDKDLCDRGYMETHDYSRKSLRHRRCCLQDEYKYHDNENEVDGGSSRRERSRRAHHHKKKSSKHQKKLDSID